MRVYISPSSQTENVGVGSYGTEAARMQQLSNIVVAALRNMGHTVYGGDNSLTLSQRIQASNNTGVDCHVALHSNAGGGTGPEVWYYSTSNNGKRLAQNILAEIEDVSGCPKSRGVKGSTDYAELKQTSAPAVIVEVAFHDNASDVNRIIGHMNEIGQAIANGINAF